MSSHPSLRTQEMLLRDAARHASQEHEGRDRLVVDIAEIDARRVYRPAGYDSILSFCMHELRLTRKAALHRIHVARVAWKHPSILRALNDGRLHVSAVAMLATYFSKENAEELVKAAGHKTRLELGQLIAERFPKQDLFRLSGPPSVLSEAQLPSQPTHLLRSTPEEQLVSQRPPGGVDLQEPAPDWVVEERFPLKVGLRRETHEKLRRAQELLGHQIPSGDVAEVLDRALGVLVRQLEKRKFGSTDRPGRTKPRRSGSGFHVPAHVRHEVWIRDQGQCTFVGANGNRCPARKMLEFDHDEPVARGGMSTTSNVRLLCRAHNQYMAEQAFGAEYMRAKREEAAKERAQAKEQLSQVMGAMRRLGFTTDESRRAAAHASSIAEASLEARVRAALAYLVPSRRREAGVPILMTGAPLA